MSSTIAVAFVIVVLVVGGLIAYAIFQWGAATCHQQEDTSRADHKRGVPAPV